MRYKENGTKNLRHLWSVLCSSSVLDKDTNNLSLNNLVEQLHVHLTDEDIKKKEEYKEKTFAFNVQLQLVTRIVKKTQDKVLVVDLKFDILNPDNKIMSSMRADNIAMKKGLKNLRFRNNISVFPVDKEGLYTICVSLKESREEAFVEVDRVPLDVKIEK